MNEDERKDLKIDAKEIKNKAKMMLSNHIHSLSSYKIGFLYSILEEAEGLEHSLKKRKST